ncbi:MAG: FKBP-type peptidyl-prolyl cis-trans isomerase [Candidatus Thermoplasmatota archaeon]
MQKEKIALITLVIIIVAALSVFLAAMYYPDIFENLFVDKTIKEGDLCDVHYIARFASNNTLFDSSYFHPENKTGGSPLNIFVTTDLSAKPPEQYKKYSNQIGDTYVAGFIEGLIGLREGQTATIGPIPPEKAFGTNKVGVGSIFTTQNISIGLPMNVEVTSYSKDSMNLRWVELEALKNFTAPQLIITDFDQLAVYNQVGALFVPPPCHLWKNASNIVDSTDSTVTIKTTPTADLSFITEITPLYDQQGLTTNNPVFYVLPKDTTVTWDESTITLTSNTTIGKSYYYTQQFYGSEYIYNFTVVNISTDKINFSMTIKGEGANESQVTYTEVAKVYSFNLSFTIPREFKNISNFFVEMLYASEIEKAGYSLHEFAGETIIFEVKIVKVYKPGSS